MADTLTAEAAPSFLCDLSADARAALLLDPAGEPAGASEEGERGERLAELAVELLEAVESAGFDLVGRLGESGPIFYLIAVRRA